MMQHLRVHDGMAGQRIVIRLRKPEPSEVAVQPVEHHGRIERDRDAGRRVGHAVDEDIRRHAKNMLRHEAIAAPHAQVSLARRPRRVASDVHAGVTRPDDQHVAAFELRRTSVSRGMTHLALEPVRRRIIRQPRMPGDARRRDHARIFEHAPVAELDAPKAIDAYRALHFRAERDVAIEVEGPRESADVVEDLPVRGIVRIVVWKREAVEVGAPFRGDEMGRLVHRRADVIEVPDAANVRIALVDVEGHAFRPQRPRHDETRGPCPDNTIAAPVVDLRGETLPQRPKLAARQHRIFRGLRALHPARIEERADHNRNENERQRIDDRVVRAGQRAVIGDDADQAEREPDPADRGQNAGGQHVRPLRLPEEADDREGADELHRDDADGAETYRPRSDTEIGRDPREPKADYDQRLDRRHEEAGGGCRPIVRMDLRQMRWQETVGREGEHVFARSVMEGEIGREQAGDEEEPGEGREKVAAILGRQVEQEVAALLFGVGLDHDRRRQRRS